MQSMVPLLTTRLVLALLALLVTPQSLQPARWAIPLALFALAVIMAHPLFLVPLMLAFQPLDAHLVLSASTPPALLQVRHLLLRVLFALQDTQEQLLALVQLVQLVVTFVLWVVMLLLVKHPVLCALLDLIKLQQVRHPVLCALQVSMELRQDRLPQIQLAQVLVPQASRLLQEAMT